MHTLTHTHTHTHTHMYPSQVVRRTKANVCQRLVPAAPVAQWQTKLEASEADVAQVVQEER
jgi:hypothetical protein